MTPEERAEKVYSIFGLASSQRRVLADVIRDAENEALERAALEAEGYGLGSAKNAAPHIRALKHPRREP